MFHYADSNIVVHVLSPETRAFRPHGRGMRGPHLVETLYAGGLRAFPPPEQQRFRTHVYLGRLPSGDNARQEPELWLTAAALVFPPLPDDDVQKLEVRIPGSPRFR